MKGKIIYGRVKVGKQMGVWWLGIKRKEIKVLWNKKKR